MIQDFLLGFLHGQDQWMVDLTVYYLGIMVCWFALCCVWLMTPIMVRWIQLRTNIIFVRRRLKHSDKIDAERGIARPKILRRTSWARRHFESFYITWEEARLRGENKAATPVELIEYLTPEVALDGAVNRRIAEVLPGIFVVLGIFGTFLGLVLGLKGIKIDELANLKQGVGQLISGLSLAFNTSLLGISLSIVFALTYRFLIRRLEKAVFALNEVMTKLFPYSSYEHYARKYLELQTDIKQGLQTLATDVATKVSDVMAPAVNEALVNNLVPILQDLNSRQLEILGGFGSEIEKMEKVITSHFEDSQKKQSEAMETVLAQYVDHLNTAFKTQFQDMGRIIEETTRVQGETKAQMVMFTEQLQKQFQAQSELIEKTGKAGQILNESLDSLEGISKELKSSAGEIATVARLLEDAASKAMEGQAVLKESMAAQIQAMTTTRGELEKAWKTITQDAGSTVELIREVLRELADGVGDQLNSALNSFDGKIAEVVERFSGTMFEAGQVIQELPQILSQSKEILEAVRSEIIAHKGLIGELTTASKDIIGPNVEKATQAFEGLSHVAQKFTTSTGGLMEWVDATVLRLQSNVGGLDEKAAAYCGEIKEWSTGFLAKLSENMKTLERDGALYSAFKELNQTIRKVEQVSRPEGAAADTAKVIIELNKTIIDLKAYIQKVSEGDGQINVELLRGLKGLGTVANMLTAQIKNELMEELKGIGQSTGKMVEAVDELKKVISLPETKKGLFGWIKGK